MTNLNASAKSRGVVLFAYNTDTVDYQKIAEQARRLITHTLNIPVTMIDKLESKQTNVRVGYAGGETWYNFDRYRAYELSPYDETILLDSDYLILDNNLLKILDTTGDYAIVTNNQNTKQTINNSMGLLSLDYVWATAVVFKKTVKAKLLFDMVGRIQRNYGYYLKLYAAQATNFRNDYAFAMADNIINGYTASPGIPWPMLTIEHQINKIEIKNNNLVIRDAESAQIIPKQSVHIIDKEYLQSEAHVNFVETICQS